MTKSALKALEEEVKKLPKVWTSDALSDDRPSTFNAYMISREAVLKLIKREREP